MIFNAAYQAQKTSRTAKSKIENQRSRIKDRAPFVNCDTMSTLPVVLVSGFLGAGKTTLMRRLILEAHARGLKACVIVNEFGASDVDGHILREADAELMQSITGGCACCAGQDDFHDTLLEVASREENEKPDVVLVETSGLADPVTLLDVLTAPGLLALLRVAAILCVADAGREDEYSARAPLTPLLHNQLQIADFILVNKADLVARSTLIALAQHFNQIAPHANLVPTQECKMNFDDVWARVSDEAPPNARSKIEDRKSNHAHSHTLFCPLPHPVEREKLEAALSTLPPEVWRAKGFVRLRGESGVLLVQYTGGHVQKNGSAGRFRLAPFHLGFGSDEPPTGIVFIGAHLAEKSLLEKFSGQNSLIAFL
jgi:G3E family GTPase